MEIDKQRNRLEDPMSDVRSLGSNYQRCSQQSRKMSIGIAPASSANMSNVTGNRYNPKGQKGSPWISPKLTGKGNTVSESFNTSKKVRSVAAVDATYSNFGGENEPTGGTNLQSGNGKQKNVDTVFPGKERNKDVITPERGKRLTQEAVEQISVPNEVVKQAKPIENRSKETLKMKLWEVLRTAPAINEELDGSGSVDVDAKVMMQKDGDKEDVSYKPRVNSDTIETDSENPEVAVSRPLTRSLTRKRGPAVAHPKRLKKKLCPANEEKNVFSFEGKCYTPQNAATRRNLQPKTNSTRKKTLEIRTTKTSDPLPQMNNIQQVSSGSKRPSNEEISLRSGMGAHGYQDQGRMKQAVNKENYPSSPEANDIDQLGEGGDLVSSEKGRKKDHSNRESDPKLDNLINEIFGPANKLKTDAQLPIPSPQAKEIDNQNYTRLLARRIIFVKDAFRFKSTLTAKHKKLGSHCRTKSTNDSAESDDTVQSMKEKYDTGLFTSRSRKIDKTEEALSISNGSGDDMVFAPERTNCNDFSPILNPSNVAGEYKGTTPGAHHFEKQLPCQSKQVDDVPPRFNYSELSPPFHFPNEVPTVEGSGDDSDSDPDVGRVEKRSEFHDAVNFNDLNSGFCSPNEVPIVEGSGDESDSDPDVGRTEKHISSPGRHGTHDAVNFNDLSPAFYSPNATRLTDASLENQEDGLERAVALFGCALEKFKNKLVYSTKKRSSEVLESTAEEIHSKFQSAKSQIEKDVTKLTNASRSKRQILEKSFEEQQEQLQLIHNKYKDEIHRHIQDYTKTVETLEAHGNDFKGVIERRKASHQRLLVQVEEAVENRISGAQRELMSIQNSGRSKMQYLKTAIAGCLEEGIFT